MDRRRLLQWVAALAAPAASLNAQLAVPHGDADGSAECNRRIAERYFEEVWNRGRLDVLDELLSSEYVNHNPSVGEPPPGPRGLKPIVAALRTAFPDLHFEVRDIVAAAGAVAIRTVMRATHRGDLFGTPATGRRVEVSQINIERIVDGRIVEHWRVTDELAMRRQLGLLD